MTLNLNPAQAPIRAISSAQDAFEGLFQAEYARVVGIAARVLADRSEAEEVAQDVFLDFHRRHAATAPYAASWLHRAAWHAALNRLRGNRRRRAREVASYEEPAEVDPTAAIDQSEDRRRLRAAMSRLPKKSAATLALRYSGLSYAEVASALGVSTGQIGTLLRRAEARLRKEVEREIG